MNKVAKITVKGWISLGLLLLVAILLFVYAQFPKQIEAYYSNGWYPGLAIALRIITAKLPFSIGDILYVLIFILLIVNVVQLMVRIKRNGFSRRLLGVTAVSWVKFFLWLYIIFKLIWGLNYDRMGIAYQLSLAPQPYQKESVSALTKELMDSLNACRRQIKDTILLKPSFENINKEAYRSYQKVSINYDFLNYRNLSVKESMYSVAGDFVGFTGYFNPFTGEAQVRSDIPRILIPYITCHEMAHQMGYASESEANFVGYLAASASKDVYFRYSVYLELFSYAQAEEIFLYSRDADFKAFEALMKYNRAYLDSLVIKDRKEIRSFFQKRRHRLSPAMTNLYDQYLKLNKQAAGINSYDDVIGWLIAYRKKYGKI